MAADRVEPAAIPTIDPSVERAHDAPLSAHARQPQDASGGAAKSPVPRGGPALDGAAIRQRDRRPTGFQSTAIVFATEAAGESTAARRTRS
jgi:hypothetical protein